MIGAYVRKLLFFVMLLGCLSSSVVWSQTAASGGVTGSLVGTQNMVLIYDLILPNSAKQSINSLAGKMPCGWLKFTGYLPDVIEVNGFVSSAQDKQNLKQLLESQFVGSRQKFNVSVTQRPFCDVLVISADARQNNDNLNTKLQITNATALEGLAPRYRAGQLVEFAVNMPAQTGFLTVMFFGLDGSVTYMFPTAQSSKGPFSPQSRIQVGNAKQTGLQFMVEPPFGQQLLLAVVSSKPILTVPREIVVPIQKVVPNLEKALGAAESDKRLVAASLFIETTE